MEEASQETGVSIAAIKIRCNKPGGSGKDGIKFEWLDDYTASIIVPRNLKIKVRTWSMKLLKDLKT